MMREESEFPDGHDWHFTMTAMFYFRKHIGPNKAIYCNQIIYARTSNWLQKSSFYTRVIHNEKAAFAHKSKSGLPVCRQGGIQY